MKSRTAKIMMITVFVTMLATNVLAASGVSLDPIPNSGTVKLSPIPSSQANQGTFTLTNPLKVDSIGALIENFVEIFSYIAILFGVLALIWVGFQFILAQGNSEKRKELTNWLLYIVIGVAVVISARLIVTVVINTLSATGTINPNVIQSAKNAAAGN